MSDRRARPQFSRRDLFLGAGVAVGSVAITATAAGVTASTLDQAAQTAVGTAIEPFFGAHQAGIRTAHQAHGSFVAFTLTNSSTRDSLRGVMKVATLEASRLCSGRPGMSDTDATIADVPARLTITFGFGPGFFDRADLASKKPVGFGDIPAFPIDQLRPEYSGGDLLIHIGSDDPLTLAHAQRHMTRVVSSIAVPRWVQSGFVRANGSVDPDATPRNLMGQMDGTENPRTDESFESQVWAGPDAGWFAGGTQLVIRRIAMKLDTWDRLSVGDKESAIGRRLDSGAPLTGEREFDVPNFDSKTPSGLTVIPDFAHIRRAHSADPKFRFLRRPLNYDQGFDADGNPDAGLIFTAYTSNIAERFVPVQSRLAEMDLLNVWTVPIGSAVFALPPGCAEGGYIGETLLG